MSFGDRVVNGVPAVQKALVDVAGTQRYRGSICVPVVPAAMAIVALSTAVLMAVVVRLDGIVEATCGSRGRDGAGTTAASAAVSARLVGQSDRDLLLDHAAQGPDPERL
jgi:hypothetical protein